MFSLMANCFSWVKKRREPWKKVTLLMIGLDNAGKTCTVADLKGEDTDGITPTVGFMTSSFTLFRYHVTMLDLGGGAKIRAVWKNYYAESYGIVFVVDSSDTERLQESRDVLHETFNVPQVSGKSLLVLANKQDIAGALDEHQIYDQLGLQELKEKHGCTCQVFTCTAVLGRGNKVDRQIKKGFQWLLAEISDNFPSLSERIDREYGEQKKLEEEERIRRRELVKKLREEREKAEREAEKIKQAAEAEEESDEGVVIGTDKKKKKETASEPETPEKKAKKKKKVKKKKKKAILEDDDEDENVRNVTPEHTKVASSIPNGLHEPFQVAREDNDGSGEEDREIVQGVGSSTAIGEDGDMKKKKKKKKKKKMKQNKTAPVAEDEEDKYELPPLAWSSPSSSMNGSASGASSLKSRRLEPIGRGSRNFAVPSIAEDQDEINALPPLRGKPSWARTRPNSEDHDVMT